MASDRDKKIRSLKDNPAGKVVSDSGGNRWEWGSSTDETTRLLNELNNDELTLERTGITPKAGEQAPDKPEPKAGPAARKKPGAPEQPAAKGAKPASARDAGGGFNPYDHTSTPRKR
jgi:hypothetical protein